MNDDDFDNFLNEAVHAVVAEWEKRNGRTITTDEKYELNDLLSGYFNDKRETNGEKTEV